MEPSQVSCLTVAYQFKVWKNKACLERQLTVTTSCQMNSHRQIGSLFSIKCSLVFGTNGGMGNECQRFLKHLADKIAQKDTQPYHVVITWLRTQISFELLRSVHACVRGSRTPFRSKIKQSLDCKINVASADIWNTCLYAFILRAFYGRWFSRH